MSKRPPPKTLKTSRDSAIWRRSYGAYEEFRRGWPKPIGDDAFVRRVRVAMLEAIRGQTP